MRAEDIIIRPLLTEKSNSLKEKGKFSFKVSPKANKIQIKDAIQMLYNVTPVTCSVMNVKGKKKRQGRFIGKTSSWRKAIVSLKQGDTIPIFEGV